MRKKLLFFATVAIAALASCSKTEFRPEVESRDVHFVVNTAENEEVKSFIDNNLAGTYTPKWSKEDELAIFVGTIGDKTKPTGVLKNTNETGTKASFGGVVSGISLEGTFKSFAPASAFATSYSSGNVGITLAESQNPSRLTIDEACDILIAKEAGYLADEAGNVVVDGLYFKRMFSVVKIALNGPASLNGEKVQKFSLTAPEGTILAGRAAIDLSTATIDKWNSKNNTVTAIYAESAPAPTFGDAKSSGNVVWLVVNHVTIASGAKVVLAGETAGYTFSKEVTLSKDLVFPQSQLAVINLTLAEENCTKKAAANNYVLHEGELVEGDYLIVYEGKAMKAAVTDKDRLNYADVAVKGTRIENSDESIIWHIAPSAEYWTIFNGNTKSFAASNGTKNQAQLLADGTDDMSLWTVTKTKDASTFEFVNKANTTAKVNANLRNNGIYGFACYATSTGGALSLYRLDGPVDNTIPSLSVDQTSKVWAADATDAFVVKVAVNSEGGDWTVTPETLSWATIAVDKTAGTITVTPNGANTAQTANEATLTVTHASDASLKKEITLKQNAAAATANDGSLEHPYTAAEAIAVIDSGTGLTGKYVKGIVKEVVSHNSLYGSMVYNIESGEKTLKIFNGYDFGHTKFLGTDDLKVGDEVVVFGDLYKYNKVYELNTDNYLISINGETQIYRGLAVSEPKIAFNVGDTFELGGKVLRVWRGKEDVDVTASATFSGYDMATEGKQTVTVTVGGESVTYEITVNPAGTVLEKNETITLANGKFVDGENPTITWSGTSCSFVQTQGQSTIPPNNSYISGPRWYKSHVISFKANTGYKITKVVVTCTSNPYATALKNSTYSPAETTSATASSAEVTIMTASDFTITMGAQSRIKSVVVYYTD